ncbi:purine-nucleoside phosphorylase, DeoD family [Desulfosporosinus acidiphilus SJ4]|uniref:Purine nucleoside phosphorylase DeoD-type n=1 Tax=Desulfosporosinus acidiphilus (strain DSM 22704 / JCM 16185 / SJ4) TaxID=646529 RepID=I4D6A1_DESAJ|nr:purine-nucleoside phosphorylase [Desulfosporosinus acidiphilus]AFM41325.1 purine-nucleoside phosphorylase, DeoD family [Desulfosporosinus acidiphilus SJ4]
MSIHIGAKQGEIASTVLLPGDPLRAKFIAETFLKDVVCYNEVRGMYGFTGTYQGKRISVQGTGMGMPSISIYVNELITEYKVQNLIRIGTCGAMQDDIHLKDVILAMSVSTDSSMNKLRFNNMDYAPTADFSLLMKAYNNAQKLGVQVRVGNILSTDTFYGDDPDEWKHWAKFGVLAVEMEAAALYTLAAKFKVKALGIMTVSDSLITHEITTSEERQKTFRNMIEIALQTTLELDV